MAGSGAPASEDAGAGPLPAPRHVAIIMDGNGRWAKARGLPRAAGHERGVEALRRTVEAAPELGIKYQTVFSFSTENWRRPAAEVSALFGLLKAYVQRDLKRLASEGVRIRVLGRREGLPRDIAALVDKAERETAHNTSFYLNIAFNYGGREEILRAVQKAADAVARGELDPAALDEARFGDFLDTAGIPDPDVLVRTSGEYRLSNFLLWQAAYAELVFMDILWPDFDGEALKRAIAEYHNRERRFGALSSGAA